jgi:hypothetical protein
MSRLRRFGFAAALLVLFSGNAMAASRDDGSRYFIRKLLSQVTHRLVQILEDARMTLPPG